MILTNNKYRFYDDKDNLLTIENDMIFGKYHFYRAKNDDNILVVNDTYYKLIIAKIKEILNEH